MCWISWNSRISWIPHGVLEILEIHRFRAEPGYPGWLPDARSGGVGGARETVGAARGGAAGVPESRNTLGMLLVVSLPIYAAIGAIWRPPDRFFENS